MRDAGQTSTATKVSTMNLVAEPDEKNCPP